MPDVVENPTGQAATQSAGTMTTPPPPASQATGQQQSQPAQQRDGDYGTSGGGRNLTIPQHAMKRIKEEERKRGAREAQEALAKELGFSSIEEMKTYRREHAQQSQRAQEQPQRTQGQQPQRDTRSERREQNRWERDRQRLDREREALARKLAHEAQQRRALQQALDAKDAEMSLREVAVAKGIRDIDYAVRLLTRHLEGKEEAELQAFDEGKFFDDLRSTHPYLFGEVTKPATTGTGTGNAPPPPKPGTAAQTQAQSGQVDARKMTREEYNEHLRKKGLSIGL